jgi:hypothetical protein
LYYDVVGCEGNEGERRAVTEMLAEERGGFRALSGKEKNNGKKMRGGDVVVRERKKKRGGRVRLSREEKRERERGL